MCRYKDVSLYLVPKQVPFDNYLFTDQAEPACRRLVVYRADFASCNGEYVLSNTTVSWAPLRPVYKHEGKNR